MDRAVVLARSDRHAKPTMNSILEQGADGNGHEKLNKLRTSFMARHISTYLSVATRG